MRWRSYNQGRTRPLHRGLLGVAARMSGIGATLRDARICLRIDLAEVEARTKIRTKYLRAIENEEWDLLPGPVYTKSFLRGYGDYLGLDSRMLVEEFKRRYEEPADHERPGREFVRGYRHRLRVMFDGRKREFLRGYGQRLGATIDERGREWVIVALGLAAAVVLGALIAS